MPTNTERITSLERAVASLQTSNTGETSAEVALNEFMSLYLSKLNTKTVAQQKVMADQLKSYIVTL